MNGMAGFMPPVLTNSSVPPIADGCPDTMLANIFIDIPLPIPRSVICSPNHIKNIVPVTRVTEAVKTNEGPGLTTTPWLCRAVVAAVD